MSNIDTILIMQISIIILIFFGLLYLIMLNNSLNYAKRIGKYSIVSLNNKQISFIDNINKIYNYIISSLSKSIKKYKIINKYSLKYTKYNDYLDNKDITDYISNKIFISIIFLFIYLIERIIKLSYPDPFIMIIIIIVGFYLPNIYYIFNDYKRRKRIENDLLNAIIMLNNSFKSGRSTMQAIEIVMNEIDGPLKDEFRKMHKEISYGISFDEVFKRFSKRVKVEEIGYITSALTILNKTGGNIIKVFSSIEKSLLNRRKLRLELEALTASSQVMIKILLFLPFIFIGIILLLDYTYFDSLFNNILGIIMILIMILFYLIYIIFISKVMKVKV